MLVILPPPTHHPFPKQHVAQQLDPTEVIQRITRPGTTVRKAGHFAIICRHPQLEPKLGRGNGVGLRGEGRGRQIVTDAIEGRAGPFVVRAAVRLRSPLLDAGGDGLADQVAMDGRYW